MQPSTVVILGSTGSIGTQGLDVISRHLDRFDVVGLAAGGSGRVAQPASKAAAIAPVSKERRVFGSR